MRTKKTIVYTTIMAELFHYGHLVYLKEAKNLGDFHICGVLSDKGSKDWWGDIITTLNERIQVIKELKCVNEVCIQDSKDTSQMLAQLRKRFPNDDIIFFKSDSIFTFEEEISIIEDLNIKFVESQYYSKLSRAEIIKFYSNLYQSNKHKIDSVVKNNSLRRIFGNSVTKAIVLEKFNNLLKLSKVEPLYYFTVKDWKNNKEKVISDILERFRNLIVVRSSSLNEDSVNFSNAGCFESILNVNVADLNEITNAIEKVVNSFKKNNDTENDQILIQNQTTNIKCSGVLFTRNLSSNLPFYLINYDNTTQDTDTVTSGIESQKVEILKNLTEDEIPIYWRKLILAIREIENLIKDIALDIEFAITNSDEIIIFQVRPLAANVKFNSFNDEFIFNNIKLFKNLFLDIQKYDSVLGQKTYLSDMAFWNPAEIIGDTSNYLDYSLYNFLILNKSWIEGLIPLGYSKTPNNLQTLIGIKSYINLSYSFLALTPEDLPLELKKKLISFYNEKLKNNPYLHDKIEFELVYNSYHFNIDSELKELKEFDFTNNDINLIKNSLKKITSNAIKNYKTILESDLADIRKLEELRNNHVKELNKGLNVNQKLGKFVNLIEECRDLGTAQFSRMARLGFIANIFLKSMVNVDLIDKNKVNNYMNSIETVATQMNNDFDKLVKNEISIETFLGTYGHLRPGTYDITKLPYNKNSDYLKFENKDKVSLDNIHFKVDNSILIKKLQPLCDEHNLEINAEKLLEFIKITTENREYFKFEFTKNISLALELLVEIGEEFNLTREDLSHLDFAVIKASSDDYLSYYEILNLWTNLINSRKKENKKLRQIPLPSLIFSEKDFEIIKYFNSRPNFITNKCITSEIINLDEIEGDELPNITGKIVLIEKADPGYDWIFTKNIAGLITKYGGVASHMAIRCAEFNIPAAIGCGDLFNEINSFEVITLDCENKHLK